LWSSTTKPAEAAASAESTPAPAAPGQPAPITPAASAPAPIYELNEVVNFEASPSWVMARWPRVSAGLAELDLQGYRVSLITGTGEADVAGSLTYYFDKQQRVKRIGLRGTTGDPRPLVGLVTGQYHLTRQPTNDPSIWLYQEKWNGKPR